ncbi:hypothetical protein, partial [Solibaculum intestinale]
RVHFFRVAERNEHEIWWESGEGGRLLQNWVSEYNSQPIVCDYVNIFHPSFRLFLLAMQKKEAIRMLMEWVNPRW